MLFVGVDWAAAEHAACLLRPDGAVARRLTVPHSPVGLTRLREAIAEAAPDAAAVLVALERPDGLLADWLLTGGYVVYALNPQAVERSRERTRAAGGTTDPADAELLARILLTDRARHAPLRPSSAQAEEIRALARQDERASRDERRLRNRLRQDLLDVFPAAAEAFPDLGAVSALAFLAEWPAAEGARPLGRADGERLLRGHSHSQPARAAARIHAALQAEALAAPAHLARAKAGAIPLAAEQLLLRHRQRAAWGRRLRALVAGDANGADGGGAHPDGEILLSPPGLDARLAARVLGEGGDRRERFPTPATLHCDAGTPARRRSPKRRGACGW